jgi:hypothetical protein
MLAVMFTAAPAFALRGGSGDDSGCKTCRGSYNAELGQSLTWCGTPEDGSGGFRECTVTCEDFGSIGACVCQYQGDYCFYIVVQP